MENDKSEWLTKEIVRKSIEYEESDDIAIEDIQITMPVEKGNNYASCIYNVKVEYKKLNDKTNIYRKSLIIKGPLNSRTAEDTMETGIKEKEVMFYSDLVPKLKLIFGDDDHVLAKYYPSKEENVIVLEDLVPQGYKLADRVKQLDYDHTVVALKTLGKFHAATFILHEQEPELIEEIGTETVFHDDLKDKFKELLEISFKMIANEIKKWPDVEKYSNWFQVNSENIWGFMCNAIKPKENEFNVLNHGDYWVSNMLFKYDENMKPLKSIPIDFQVPRYASPAIDFHYFMSTSVQDDIRSEKYEDFIQLYVNELNLHLKKYGSAKLLDESDFKRSLSETAYFSLYTSSNVLPVVTADPKEVNILGVNESIMDDLKSIKNHPFREYYRSEKYIKILVRRLNEFENMGLISFTIIQ